MKRIVPPLFRRYSLWFVLFLNIHPDSQLETVLLPKEFVVCLMHMYEVDNIHLSVLETVSVVLPSHNRLSFWSM
jgi:hypothetical protein